MSRKRTLFLTGATGFVGRAFLQRWLQLERGPVMALTRKRFSAQSANVTAVEVGDSGLLSENLPLQGVDVVVHCAARAHIMNDTVSDPLQAFREVNTVGTLNVARQAASAGVRRFIFISSVKVNGEETASGAPYRAEDIPAPKDYYAISKCEAEQGLRVLADETGMEVVIIRPPLVYGPGVKGNFASLVKVVASGIPLPLGSVQNKRSLISLANLVDLMMVCVDHPSAVGQIFMASDGEDLSTPELLRRCAESMGKRAWLIPFPPSLMRVGGRLLGKEAVVQRLFGSLQVDIEETKRRLHWQPPVSIKDGLYQCFGKTSD